MTTRTIALAALTASLRNQAAPEGSAPTRQRMVAAYGMVACAGPAGDNAPARQRLAATVDAVPANTVFANLRSRSTL